MTRVTPVSVVAIPIMANGGITSPNIRYATKEANIGDKDIIRSESLGPIMTKAANNPMSPIPNPMIPLKPIQNNCSFVAAGNAVPRIKMCAEISRITAMAVR